MQDLILADFPLKVVKLILSHVASTERLATRTSLAFVCRYFAVAVKEQTHVEISSESLVGSSLHFSRAAKIALLQPSST